MNTPTNKLEWALWLAEKGFFILQLSAGSKNPKRGFGWLKASTDDPSVIRQWFEEDPDMNYGVCPGDHHVILDLDDKPWAGKDGISFLIDLEIEHGIIGETFTVHSPSGGKHLYFSTPVTLGNASGFPKDAGIDVRGAHGYVVGPGSELIEGSCKATDTPGPYVTENVESDIIEVPDWLLSGWLREKRQREEQADTPLIPLDLPENIEKAESFLKSRAPAVEGHGGNQWTYDTAAYLRDFGLTEGKAIEVLFSSGWNDKCEPAWDWDELSDVVEHAYRYSQNRSGSKADFMSMYERLMDDVEAEEVGEESGNLDDLDDHIFDPAGFTSRGKRREYVIPNWLPAHGFTALLAKRSMGKSTILLDLACRVATNTDWQGLPIKEDYVAIYLCGEDDEGLELNMVAWQLRNREIPKDRMIIADVVTNLMSAEDVEKWAQKLHKMLNGRKAIVFLDTWQRATSMAGQNKDEDMQLCVHHAEALARSLGGPLIGAFHPPKYNDNTIHGSAVIENSTVAIWVLEDYQDGGKRLRVERIKGPGFGSYRLFKFSEVEMKELDSFGNPQKGLVPMKTGGSEDSMTSVEQERNEKAREAWAWLVRGTMRAQSEKGPGEKRITPNRNQMAEEIERLMGDDAFMKEYGERAIERDLPKSKDRIREALSTHFWNNSKPFTFDDMIRLSIDRTVGKGVFRTKRAEDDE